MFLVIHFIIATFRYQRLIALIKLVATQKLVATSIVNDLLRLASQEPQTSQNTNYFIWLSFIIANLNYRIHGQLSV